MIWKSKQTIKKKFFVCNFWMLKNDKLCWLWMIDIFMVFLSVYVLTWHSFLWLKNWSKHGFHLDIICRCRIKISQILLECSCHYCANWLKLSIVKVQNVTVTMQWLLLENKASMTLYYLPSIWISAISKCVKIDTKRNASFSIAYLYKYFEKR